MVREESPGTRGVRTNPARVAISDVILSFFCFLVRPPDRWDSLSLSLMPIPTDVVLPGVAGLMLQ